MFLTADEVVRLTGKKRWTAQRRALDGMGIAYRLSARGEPLVRQSALDEQPQPGRNRGPRWDRLNA